MSEDSRRRVGPSRDLLQVSAADAAGVDPYQDFAGADFRHSNRFKPDVALGAIHSRQHGSRNFRRDVLRGQLLSNGHFRICFLKIRLELLY